MDEVGLQLGADLAGAGHGLEHEGVDPVVLVQAGHDDLVGHRLPLPPDRVQVQVLVDVHEGVHVDEGLEGVQVVDVEAMLRQAHARVPQHLGAVHEGVHHEVLVGPEAAHVAPRAHPPLRQDPRVAHGMAVRPAVGAHVHEVRHHQVRLHALIAPLAQLRQDPCEGGGVEGVVGVDHLDPGARRRGDPGVDRPAVALVLLADHPEALVGGGEALGDLAGGVGRAVVDDDDLDLAAGDHQGLQTRQEEVRGVVGGDDDRQQWGAHAGIIPWPGTRPRYPPGHHRPRRRDPPGAPAPSRAKPRSGHRGGPRDPHPRRTEWAGAAAGRDPLTAAGRGPRRSAGRRRRAGGRAAAFPPGRGCRRVRGR